MPKKLNKVLIFTILIGVITIYYSYQANKIANEANEISNKALEKAEKANNLSRQFLETSKESNLIAEKSNNISQENSDFNIINQKLQGLKEELLYCEYPFVESLDVEKSLDEAKYLINRNKIEEANKILNYINETCIISNTTEQTETQGPPISILPKKNSYVWAWIIAIIGVIGIV